MLRPSENAARCMKLHSWALPLAFSWCSGQWVQHTVPVPLLTLCLLHPPKLCLVTVAQCAWAACGTEGTHRCCAAMHSGSGCGGFHTLMPLNWKNFFSSACGCVGSVYVKSYCNNHFISQLKDCIRKLLEGWVVGDTGTRHLLSVCSSSV